jgi:hypothetical protein
MSSITQSTDPSSITLKCKVKKSYEVKNKYLLRAGTRIRRSAHGNTPLAPQAPNSASLCLYSKQPAVVLLYLSYKRSSFLFIFWRSLVCLWYD